MNTLYKLNIIPRTTWTARIPTEKMNYLSNINYLVIHHTTFDGDYKIGEDAKEVVRDIQKYHMSKKYDKEGNLIKDKWADIGYHYLISKDGQIFEGRSKKFKGSHAYGLNNESLGIALLGDFSHKEIYPTQLKSLVQLLAWLSQIYSINTSKIIGHKDVLSISLKGTITECPGSALHSQLPFIREKVEAILV
ncbi:peptidoglycan recognition protein family protein [Oceanirhabdus sp. W0125-5]|uniref:peptidoglycan recognition protein family protein n=1 Tax=Oceanirhabdus sp. W0125-5 TaxID=2999116 RepID=UPI0022F3079E|nr:peptidoglycan recognition family protein [Oceanirhabdus sp. W0125-5]WBW95818.1 peptidoglycan recognition family protein [Oceanirhabdus sp. W0125-5]